MNVNVISREDTWHRLKSRNMAWSHVISTWDYVTLEIELCVSVQIWNSIQALSPMNEDVISHWVTVSRAVKSRYAVLFIRVLSNVLMWNSTSAPSLGEFGIEPQECRMDVGPLLFVFWEPLMYGCDVCTNLSAQYRPRPHAQLDVSYVYGVSPVEFCPSLRSPWDSSARHYKSVLFIYNKYSWPAHEIFMYIPRAIQFVRVTTLLFESPPCIYNIVNGDYLSGCFTYFHTK